MKSITKRRSTHADDGLVVRADWTTGARTPAWDRLWRAILSDFDPEAVPTGGQETVREGDDG